MRNRMTRLASAAIIAVVIVVGLRAINGSTAWANMVRALSDANNIHIKGRRTYVAKGEVVEFELWLKDRKKSRGESHDGHGGWMFVDDGMRRLWVSHQDKTVEFRNSEADEEVENWDQLWALQGEDSSVSGRARLIRETDEGLKVYEILRDAHGEDVTITDTVWIDPRSHLPMRIARQIVNSKTGEMIMTMEATCDYDLIPADLFEFVVPPGYTDITNLRTEVLSGKVFDESGKPVAGAEVVTSEEDLRGRANDRGEFSITLHVSRSLRGFPLMIRATQPGDPNHVAWTLLRNPRHELRPLFKPDDGKSKLEDGGEIFIHLIDERSLEDFIPPDPGTLVFQNETDRYPSEVHDIVLTMQPVRVITGRITDGSDRPIANALVWMSSMEIAAGENEIWVHEFGRTDEEEAILSSLSLDEVNEIRRGVPAVTDQDGYYVLGHLPDVWFEARLEVKAEGYTKVAKMIRQHEGNDFRLIGADVTIRGTVVDDHGEPLVGREVEIDVDSDEDIDFEVEEIVTDADGRFELTGVPAVAGLEVQIRADEKPRDWGKNELTRGRPFIYYLMVEHPVTLEPDKKEYSVNIVAPRPDITLEIAVKDAEGNLLAGIPVGVCSPGFTEREWYISRLVGKTDSRGMCTITEVPRIDPLQLWLCVPDPRTFRDWESMSELSDELKTAMRECRSKHAPKVVTVELEEGKKAYKVSVGL